MHHLLLAPEIVTEIDCISPCCSAWHIICQVTNPAVIVTLFRHHLYTIIHTNPVRMIIAVFRLPSIQVLPFPRVVTEIHYTSGFEPGRPLPERPHCDDHVIKGGLSKAKSIAVSNDLNVTSGPFIICLLHLISSLQTTKWVFLQFVRKDVITFIIYCLLATIRPISWEPFTEHVLLSKS